MLIRPEEFLACLKEFLEVSSLNPDVRDELRREASEFQFFSSAFQKYKDVVNRLRLSSHMDSDKSFLKMTNFYVNSHWIIFVLTVKEFLGNAVQSPEALLLLASVTIEMMQSEDLISDHLMSQTGGGRVTNAVVVAEVCGQFGIKSRDLLVKSTGRVTEVIRGLKDKGVLGPRWNSVSSIQQSAEKLEAMYQRSMKVDDLDLRFFLRDRHARISERPGAPKATPIHKQKLVYKQFQPEVKHSNPRSLDYDAILTDPPKIETPKPAPTPTSNASGVTAFGLSDRCFQSMAQSPYRTPARPPATPMTRAMELYNWFTDAMAKPYVSEDGHLLQDRPGTPIDFFLNLLDAELQVRILNDTIQAKTGVLSEINTCQAKRPSGLQPDQIPKREERQLLFLNFYYHLLETFIQREQQWQSADTSQLRHELLVKSLKSVIFHKTLLVYTMEALYYILNQRDTDFQSILEAVGLNVCQLYETNIASLNFETLVPATLRKHFFDVEKLILSYHIWERRSPIFRKELTQEYSVIFERAMVHSGKIVASLGQALNYSRGGLERVWELFGKILAEKRAFLAGRFIEQVLLCCFYLVSKISGLGVKFQDIIVAFQKSCTWASTSLVNTIVFHCLVAEEQRTDVISFYNGVFIGECEKIINTVRSKPSNPENMPPNGKGHDLGGLGDQKAGSPRGMVGLDTGVGLKSFAMAKSPPLCQPGAPQTKGLDVLKSPLRDLLSTPFVAYNKESMMSSQLGGVGSPLGMMMRIGSPLMKMPVHSKKILDLRAGDHKDEGGRNQRAFEKKEAFVPVGFDNLEEKLKKFM